MNEGIKAPQLLIQQLGGSFGPLLHQKMGSGLLNYSCDLHMGAVVLIVQSPPVGITAQLKWVFKATCHRGCLPRCLAPCSGEGDIYDSSPREHARRT